ncbi:MAG: putative hydroxymethylpyrimidine transport system permease protein [Solirubrobacteraceae bacterium]|nr:putative hydroxymethylpyrimidine transport system permease protein [Solirubrobacteraceae bacterium]
MRIARRTLPPLALLATLLGAWELYVDLGGVDGVILSAPHQIAQAIADDRSLLWSNFLVTFQEVIFGIAVAAVVGVALAVVIHLSASLRGAAYPLVVASQTIPVVLLAPLLMLWFGFGILPKVIVVALVSFFSIVVTTLDGLAGVDPQLLKLMRTFDASRWRTLRSVEFPAALPGVFTGTKIAVAVAVIGAVIGEMTGGSNAGLGYLFLLSINQLLTPRAYAAVVILSIFAIALFALLTLAERLALPWAYEPRGERSS